MPHARSIVFAPLIALALALAGGCTVDGDQCSTDGDCVPIFGAAVEQLQCVTGVCSRRGPTFANEAGAPVLTCKTNGECKAQAPDDPAFCREERCVPIRRDGIYEVSPSYLEGDPLFIGVLMMETVPVPGGVIDSPYDKINVDAIRLATSDWYAGSEGALQVAGMRRPITTVYCDFQASLDKLNACFDHMTKTLRAPIVVVRSDAEAAALLPVAIDRDVVLYCTDCETINFQSTDPQGHLWFGSASSLVTFPARWLWIERLEKAIRQERSLAAGTDIKVLLMSTLANPRLGRALADEIPFNGKTAQQNVASGALIHRVVDRSVPNDFRAFAAEAVERGVDIVIVQNMGRDFHFHLMPELEAQWPAGKPRPRYVTGSDEQYEFRFRRSIGANDDLRRRVTGVGLNVNDPQIDANFFDYLSSFASAPGLGYDPLAISTGFEGYYVAAYALASAVRLTTADPKNIRGRDVIESLQRLVHAEGSTLIDVRASDVARGINALADGRRIDLRGLNSTLDWDPATGALRSNASVYCFKRSPTASSIEELWVYDAEKGPLGEPNMDVCSF